MDRRERIDKINREIESMIYSKAKLEINLEKLKEERHNLLQMAYNSEDFKSKCYKYECEKYTQYHKIDNIILEEDSPNIGIQGLCITIHTLDDFKGVSINNLIYWTQRIEIYTEISEEEFMEVYNKVIKELGL